MSFDPTRQQLQQAYELIRSGRKSEAEALLLPILKADEDNANAWWLLAHAVSDAAETREALENVLRLRPGDAKAQKMLDDLNARYPADEFPMEDTGFGALRTETFDLPEKPKRSGQPVLVKQSSGGTNPLIIILAVVGVIAVIGCAVCFILPTVGITLFGQQIVEQVMTAAPELQEIMLTITVMPEGQFFTGDLIQRGNIEYGQTVRGTVDTFDDDGWTFRGSAGDRVTIELNAQSSELDPQLYLLDPSNNQIAENDDVDFANDNRNSRVNIALPASGTYTIRVSAFGAGGPYELILRRE